MANNITDSHVHFHYEVDFPDERIESDMRHFEKIRRRYIVRKVGGIFLPNNMEVAKRLGDKSIYRGIYISGLDEADILKKAYEDFEFVKIHDALFSPECFIDEYLRKVVDKGAEAGFEKFQIHTESIQKPLLDMVESCIKKNGDMKLYLVHGANSLYNKSFFDVDKHSEAVAKIRNMENNLLLGTSSSSGGFMIPNENIRNAVKDGLESQIVFESGFTLGISIHNPDFYKSCIENVAGSVGYNKKIFEENSRIFFE